jgi:hypothetical protein
VVGRQKLLRRPLEGLPLEGLSLEGLSLEGLGPLLARPRKMTDRLVDFVCSQKHA